MNFLRTISEFEQRRQHVMSSVGNYWLDRLAQEVQSRHRQEIAITGKVLAVLRNPELERELLIPGLNIVTNDGDLYYAELACEEAPTDDFDAAAAGFHLGTLGTAPNKTSTDVGTEDTAGRKATDATYPQTADPDGDNTGAGADIATWRVSYLTSEANIVSITEGAIVDDRTTSTAALTHFLFASAFTKTSSDTLKVFVNHEMLGV